MMSVVISSLTETGQDLYKCFIQIHELFGVRRMGSIFNMCGSISY